MSHSPITKDKSTHDHGSRFSQGELLGKYKPPRKPYFDEDVKWVEKWRTFAPELHGLATDFKRQTDAIRKNKRRDAGEERLRKKGLVKRESPYKTLQWVAKVKNTKAENFASRKFHFSPGFSIDEETGPVSVYLVELRGQCRYYGCLHSDSDMESFCSPIGGTTREEENGKY